MWKDAKAILLPTNKIVEQRVGYYIEGLSLFESKHPRGKKELSLQISMNGMEIPNPQHLYIISLDEEIKEEDWYIHDGTIPTDSRTKLTINKWFNNHSDKLHYLKDCKKVIATTDSSLFQVHGYDMKLPFAYKISQQFIKEWIAEYNKGNIIEDVEVEYESNLDNSSGWDCIDKLYHKEVFNLKISKDNFISLRRKEQRSYTEEDVENILVEYTKSGYAHTSQPIKFWIEYKRNKL